MSKCSVFRTRKSNFLYWTLFCPKYWAEAGTAASVARPAIRRTARACDAKNVFDGIAAGGAAIDVPSAVERRVAELEVGAIRASRAIVGDCLLDFLARSAFGPDVVRVHHALYESATKVSGNQIFNGDRDKFAAAKRRIWLGKRVIDWVEQPLLLVVPVQAPWRNWPLQTLEVELRQHVVDALLLEDLDSEVGRNLDALEDRIGRLTLQSGPDVV